MQRKTGSPSEADLFELSAELAYEWKNFARALSIQEARIKVIEKDHDDVIERCYQSLLSWKQVGGVKATYEELEAALCHGVLSRKDLAEKYCYHPIPQKHGENPPSKNI